ncbi:MAG TPA: DUF4124 domain-containing protein [Casimicrobiaceae bacterium]|nr:DUF4124 domain-containing protein [Casimicrobiaceae bacterium]
MTPSRAILVVPFLAALSAQAQVYKCVDAQGRTTYQQAPCDGAAKGTKVEITRDNGVAADAPDLEAKWAAAAKAGQVEPGMPKRFVQAAWGAPAETRPGNAADRASEIWIYRRTEGIRRVGFLDGRVAWQRADEPASPLPDTPSMPAGAVPGERPAIAVGQDCATALAIAGTPERSEAVLLPSRGRDGRPTTAPGMRHVFESDGGSPPRRMAIVCLDDIVTEIQRPTR